MRMGSKPLITIATALCQCFVLVCSQLGSNCTTPLDEFAYCIPLEKCNPIMKSLPNLQQQKSSFLNASLCNSTDPSEPLVCCGTAGDYKKVDYAAWILDTLPRTQKIMELLPTRTVCGVQSYSDRIVGGNVTDIDEFPWMALLEYRDFYGDSAGYQCGGVLISSRYILTAAHCVKGTIEEQTGKLFRVRLGEYDLNADEDCIEKEGFKDCTDGPEDYFVEDIIAHPGFIRNKSGIFNDIALVRLDRDVNVTDFIVPICLPVEGETSKPGDRLFVAGWGRTENASSSPIKLKVNLTIVEPENCSAIYSRIGINIEKYHLCAKGSPGRDACSGDSGGPLMQTIPNLVNRWYVDGIVSFGPRFCGLLDVPGVYSHVKDFMDWILDNIKS